MSVDAFQSVAGAPAGEIELAQVERELAALWAQAAPEDPGAEPAVLRARSLILLVLGHNPSALERVRPIAARTTLAQPSRILLLAPENGIGEAGARQASSLDTTAAADGRLPVGARISTFCHRLGGGGRHVCCEEITVLARRAAAARLREAALPLLVPDLPVHLWLPGPDRYDLSALQPLVDLADEVIWSARRPHDVPCPTPHRARPAAYVDLDWLRLRPWCELTAQLFDSPDRRSDLKRIKSAEVTVAGPAMDRPGAGWLWVGWLASRLGWTAGGAASAEQERSLTGPLGPVAVRVIYRSPGQPAASVSTRRHGDAESTEAAGQAGGSPPHPSVPNSVTSVFPCLRVDSEAVPQGELLSVRLHLHGWTVPLTLDRCPSRDREDLCISAGGVRTIHLGNRDEAALLGEALAGAARDRTYEAAWEMAVRLWGRG